MKKTHLVAIVLIVVAIAAIIASISDASTYASFKEAYSDLGQEYHVVGTLDTTKESIYEPEKNPDMFEFHMLDNNGISKRVVLHMSKPQDFEKSEQIVIIGKASEDAFHASQILMKCPSKYEDGTSQFQTPEEYEKTRG